MRPEQARRVHRQMGEQRLLSAVCRTRAGRDRARRPGRRSASAAAIEALVPAPAQVQGRRRFSSGDPLDTGIYHVKMFAPTPDGNQFVLRRRYRRPGERIARRTRCVVGAGPERARRGDRARARGALGAGARGRATTVGGGARSAELTLPGFVHDVCSAVHPLALASPFLRTLPLDEHGLELDPPGRCRSRTRSTTATPRCSSARSSDGDGSGATRAPTGGSWRRSCATPARAARRRARARCEPAPSVPLARFGLRALRSATRPRAPPSATRARARCSPACAAHSILPLEQPPTAAVGAGARAPAHACRLADRARRLAGDRRRARLVPALARRRDRHRPPRRVASTSCRRRARRALRRHAAAAARASPATGCPRATAAGSRATATAPACSRSTGRSTGRSRGSGRRAARAARCTSAARSRRSPPPRPACRRGEHPERPFVLRRAAEPLRPDARAPAGKHTLWAYCHVPHGSTVDMTARIEAQIERFAPGFRDLHPARATRMRPAGASSATTPNYVGGDINGGAHGPAPARAPCRTRRRPAPVPVLVVDAAGRRRARHVRLLRRPRRSQILWRRSSVRPMTIRWISDVPSPISSSGASR